MRLIDADAVFPWYIEMFKGMAEPHEVRFSMNDIRDNLWNIPTIEPNATQHTQHVESVEPMQWIPCTVRLPEEGVLVLATNDEDIFFASVEGREWKILLSQISCFWENVEDTDDIVAWMPLPEPYKGGAE